jgi:predicted RNase H-like HicB family nuclease
MRHHLAVLLPLSEGGWRVHFPDFPGCRAEGSTVEAALAASTSAVFEQARWYRQQRVSLPSPRSYDDIRHFAIGWATLKTYCRPIEIARLSADGTSPPPITRAGARIPVNDASRLSSCGEPLADFRCSIAFSACKKCSGHAPGRGV